MQVIPNASTFLVIEWTARLWGEVLLAHTLKAFQDMTSRGRAARHSNWGLLVARPWISPRGDMHALRLTQKNAWAKGIPNIEMVPLDELYCVCRSPWDPNGLSMLACDGCNHWFHLNCVGLKDAPTGQWLCETCGGPAYMAMKPPKAAKAGGGGGGGGGTGTGRRKGKAAAPAARGRGQAGDVFTVEKVLDDRIVGGARQFKLKWKGFPDSASTWEAESNIMDPLLLSDYYFRRNTARNGGGGDLSAPPLSAAMEAAAAAVMNVGEPLGDEAEWLRRYEGAGLAPPLPPGAASAAAAAPPSVPISLPLPLPAAMAAFAGAQLSGAVHPRAWEREPEAMRRRLD